MIAIISLGLLFNSWLSGLNRNVLGYATEMSSSSLLTGTNTQRSANGLGALALSSLLNQAAQAKAQDMMVNNYWAHDSPTGVTPWYWISSVGYAYTTAGENLAYGFTTSSATITGWMNSPGHRANILNTSFTQVGFGIVNAPNFNGTGPQTIVVAMYAKPVVSAPAPAPAPPAPAPVAKSTPAPVPKTVQPAQKTEVPAPTPAPVAEAPAPEATPTENEVAQEPVKPEEVAQAAASSSGGIISEQSKDVTRIQTLSATNASWGGFAISLLASVALLAFLLRHSLAWHRFIVKGESFVLHHPIADIAFVIIAILGFILVQGAGSIK